MDYRGQQDLVAHAATSGAFSRECALSAVVGGCIRRGDGGASSAGAGTDLLIIPPANIAGDDFGDVNCASLFTDYDEATNTMTASDMTRETGQPLLRPFWQ